MSMKEKLELTRRQLLVQSANVAAGMTIFSPSMASLAQGTAINPHAERPGSNQRVAQLLTLDKVRLQDGPFRDCMERNRAYLVSLDPDRFLYYYRTTAGLKAKAEPYGGWEERVGRMLGHYLSACSMYARATGETTFYQRQSYMVSQLAECQRANGDGYVGGVADAKRIFGEIGKGKIYFVRGQLNGIHAPWYMLHKMMAGLRDAYVYAGNPEALVVLTGFSDWSYALTDRLSDAEMQRMLEDEHGGVNEIFADMYGFTGHERYLTLSRRFNHRVVLQPLTREQDRLDGLHANTQIPTVLGLYRQYEVSGDKAAQRGGEFFWKTVTERRSYVIGGDSDKEHFYPIGQMAQNLSPATAETCNSYNMLKLTDRLFAGEPREVLAAYGERVLWNDLLASLDTVSPGMTYYMSLKPGHFKTFSKPFDSFWCCVGTGMENHAKYGESLYFQSDDVLWINQFVASEVVWDSKRMRVLQTTRFPEEPRSRWQVTCDRPVRATLLLRHPQWAGSGFAVKVNGKGAGSSKPGSYVKLDRMWRTGDTVTAELPMRLSLEPMRDDPSLQAVLYGPIVLAGLLGRNDLPSSTPYAAGDQLQYANVPDPAVPTLARLGADRTTQTGPLEFTLESSAGKIRFLPLAKITRDRYSVYWKLA